MITNPTILLHFAHVLSFRIACYKNCWLALLLKYSHQLDYWANKEYLDMLDFTFWVKLGPKIEYSASSVFVLCLSRFAQHHLNLLLSYTLENVVNATPTAIGSCPWFFTVPEQKHRLRLHVKLVFFALFDLTRSFENVCEIIKYVKPSKVNRVVYK